MCRQAPVPLWRKGQRKRPLGKSWSWRLTFAFDCCRSGDYFMSMKLAAFKRAAQAAKKAMGPLQYGVNGEAFVCACCGHDKFTAGVAPMLVLNTLTCAQCGHVEFFGKEPPIL